MSPLTYPRLRRAVSYPTGTQLVEALLKDAEPAVAAFASPEKRTTLKLLRLDRQSLEFFAIHGRNMTAYNAAKERYVSQMTTAIEASPRIVPKRLIA